MSQRRFESSRLRGWLQELFEKLGASPRAAACVAESLLEAELAGHESHGLIRVSEYARQVEEGRLVPAAEPEVLAESSTQLHLDCQGAFGAYAAGLLTERLLQKARVHGLAAGALRGAGHLGRAGDYPARLAADGLFAVAFVNGGGKVPRVAPYGGRQAFLGTNPVALAVPGPVKEPPVVVDFSTAAVASGKIRVLHQRGQSLPGGWILDAEGQPSQDPADYYAGGMLVTAAGHKGYGLSLVADLLAGLVSGTGTPGLPGFSGANGFFMLACSLELFLAGPELRERVSEWARALRGVTPREADQPVQLAGEPEARLRARRLKEGVPLEATLLAELAGVASRLGLQPL